MESKDDAWTARVSKKQFNAPSIQPIKPEMVQKKKNRTQQNFINNILAGTCEEVVGYDFETCQLGLCTADITVTDKTTCETSSGSCSIACEGCSQKDTCESTFYCAGTDQLRNYLEASGVSGTGACFAEFLPYYTGTPYCDVGQENPWGMF